MTNIKRRKYKISRSIMAPLWGHKKDPVHKKNYRPGQHGRSLFRSMSEFGKQILAKQSFKRYYEIREKQFKRIFNLAHKKKGNTGDLFIGLLETRLCSVVYNSCLAPTIFTAKQLVSHKHVLVNGKAVNRSSYTLKVGDIVTLHDSVKNIPPVLQAIESQERKAPDYLQVNVEKREIKLVKMPTFSEVPYPAKMRPEMVIEFYSR
ncbi:MAG: 30S ribosomal protein S4 [Rickettsiaceae bacterium H1]|nr:30S ribosomal protein S4 [Rickettsiaceae bacterium H1]